MARSLNRVQLIGHAGGDPDVRETANGGSVVNLTLATGESWIDKNTGQKMERTEWHRIVVFGKIAEAVQQFVKKGHRLYIEGKQRTREWEDDAGVKRYTTEVVVDMSGSVLFLEGRKDGSDAKTQSQYEAYMNGPGGNDISDAPTHGTDNAEN